MTIDKTFLSSLSKESLIHLIQSYDEYLIDFSEEHGNDGCYPVCLGEFYDNEYQEILKKRESPLAYCKTCGYIGNVGVWKGTVYLEGNTEKEFSGYVKLDECGETWDLDGLDLGLKEGEIHEEIDGMAYCPCCDSLDFD